MNKTIRIVLYVLSLLTVAGVIAAAVLTGGQAKPASAPGETAEEEQTEMSDAQATLDGAATPDGILDVETTSGENANQSDDAATVDEKANANDTKDAGGTTIIQGNTSGGQAVCIPVQSFLCKSLK